MDNSRNYILDRLKSKRTSIEEFNYDQLQAPPLSMFLSPFDIQELNSIARSIRYSAKPEVRYQEIDRVMRRRGLVKFAAGTNRVVYRHPEFQDFLIKVAADAVGLGDNPAEYRNQFLLKPFVTKCFEISPCGTVGIFERVNPITSREEFLSVADDVFELLTEWIIGKYVIADCGSKFFMNFGVRRGFGIVLLDYPYLYELDGNLLYCRKPDPLSQSGKCDGVIDYDDGFNFLRCTKCGATYKAKELENKIKDKELIVERKGEVKMKIKVSGGSNNVNNTVVTGNEVNNENFKETKATTPKVTVKKEEPVVVNEEPKEKEKVDSIKEASQPINKSVNGVSTTTVIKQAVTISEEIKNEALAAKAERERIDEENIDIEEAPVDKINRAIALINEAIGDIELDSVKNDRVNDIIMAVVTNVANSATFNSLMKGANYIYDEINDDDEYNSMLLDENLVDIISKSYDITAKVEDYDIMDGDLSINYSTVVGLAYEKGMMDPEDYTIVLEDTSKDYVIKLDGILDEFFESVNGDEEESAETIDEEVNAAEADDNKEDIPENVYTGMAFYDGKVMNINTIFPSQKSQDVIVIVDQDGNYLSRGNEIIAVDILDDRSVNESAVVSKEWLDSANEILDSEVSSDNIPVGAIPVNGEEDDAAVETDNEEESPVKETMSMEEFLNGEETNNEEE